MTEDGGLFWHGSPFAIPRGGLVVPGAEIGVDRYAMSRNTTVFIATEVEIAASMGSPMRDHESRGNFYASAPFLYLVHPVGLFDTSSTECVLHIMKSERQCRKAVVLERYEYVIDDVSKTLEYSYWGSEREAKVRYRPVDRPTAKPIALSDMPRVPRYVPLLLPEGTL